MILNFLNAQKPLSSSIFEPAWLAYFALYFYNVNSLQKHSCLEVLNLVLQQAHRHIDTAYVRSKETKRISIFKHTQSVSILFQIV
jgi:hypothetical protein